MKKKMVIILMVTMLLSTVAFANGTQEKKNPEVRKTVVNYYTWEALGSRQV